MKAKAEEYRKRLVEAIVENDEALMEKYLAGEEIGIDDLKRVLRVGVVKLNIFPVLCGSALKNKGVQMMLDAVVDYLPSPLDVPPLKGTDPDDHEKTIECIADDKQPFAALAFKVAADPFVGKLIFSASTPAQ